MILHRGTVEVTNKVEPMRTKVEDIPLTARMRSFRVSGKSELQLVFQNTKGQAYDLTDFDGEFKCLLRELVSGSHPIQCHVSIEKPEEGLLSIKIPLLPHGIYRGIIGMYLDNDLILENHFRVYSSHDLARGLTTIEDIRLLIRDTHPEESYLLEDLTFSDEEVVLALERTIRYFNEVPPDLGRYLTTANFPWPYHLAEGVMAQLFLIAANAARKNSLQYSAGGLSFSDQEKEGQYLQAYQLHWQSYQRFVSDKKTEINMNSCYGDILSPYSFL